MKRAPGRNAVARTHAQWIDSRARRSFIRLWIRHLGQGSVRRAAAAMGMKHHKSLVRWWTENCEIAGSGYTLLRRVPLVVEQTLRRRTHWDRSRSFAVAERMYRLLERGVRPPALIEPDLVASEVDEVHEAFAEERHALISAWSVPIDDVEDLDARTRDHGQRYAAFEAERAGGMRPITYLVPGLTAADRSRIERNEQAIIAAARGERLQLRRLPRGRWVAISEAEEVLLKTGHGRELDAPCGLLARDLAGGRYAFIEERADAPGRQRRRPETRQRATRKRKAAGEAPALAR
jgi:hypothetical protein